MHSQAGIIVTVAVLDDHVMADLETDSIPVVITGDHLPHRVAIAVLQENTATIVAIEILAILAITIIYGVNKFKVLLERSDVILMTYNEVASAGQNPD